MGTLVKLNFVKILELFRCKHKFCHKMFNFFFSFKEPIIILFHF